MVDAPGARRRRRIAKRTTIIMGAAALMLPLLGVPGSALPAATERQAVEIGTVEWGRDFEGALE